MVWPPLQSVGEMVELSFDENRYGPIAAADCPQCPSDSADPFFVFDPKDNTLICTVLRCCVCGALSLV